MIPYVKFSSKGLVFRLVIFFYGELSAGKGVTFITGSLAHNIAEAHENDTSFFLAMHLKSLLEEHQTINRPPTAVESKGLIVVAAKAMASG